MTQTIEVLIEGGKATPAPPLGPSLSQLKINVGDVIKEINNKTSDFKDMQVPVKIKVNDDKSFDISVGTPPVTSLIKKELNISKASQHPGKEEIADIHIEQIIKIAKMKKDIMHGDFKDMVKQIVGTCLSMGILVEGKNAKETIKMINDGKFDKEISSKKTELSEKEKKELETEKKKLAEDIKKMKEEEMTKAKEIASKITDKTKLKIALEEAEISKDVIDEITEEAKPEKD